MSPITRDPSTATDARAGGAAGIPGAAPAPTVAVRAETRPEARADDGRSTRWEDHREARRVELVRVARRVVHHAGPDASMDDIAAAAGTSKSIVYRYFTDKDGLQLAVAAAVVADIRDALDAAATEASTPRDALRRMVDTYLAMIESSPHVYTFVTRGGSVGHFLDSVTELVAAPFVRALGTAGASGISGAAGVDAAGARLWAAGAVGFVRGVGERWLTGPPDAAPGMPATADVPDAPASADVPDAPASAERAEVAAQVAAWLWAGPVGVLSKSRATRSARATGATRAIRAIRATDDPGPSRVDDDAEPDATRAPGETA